MKAMILAAGVGSRLAPLTDSMPKALVPVGGKPLIGHVLDRMKSAGVTEFIVNTHHLAEQVEQYLSARRAEGLRIEISREEILLDTGGGLKKASWFFNDGKPFLLHNADVLSEVAFPALLDFLKNSKADAALCVRQRESKRHLLFCDGLLRGREKGKERFWAGPARDNALPLAFDGIHALTPAVFSFMKKEGPFSINDTYLAMAEAGKAIAAFRTDKYYWADIGTMQRLETARAKYSKTI